MEVWVFNDPNPKAKELVSDSLKNGISRFGWSYIDSGDLKDLKNKAWELLSEDEKIIWKKSNFLLRIQPGDWVVHVNIPTWGMCSAAKVVGPYFFEAHDNAISDFRHCLGIEPSSLVEFSRNSEGVHPHISRRLKLRGRYWRIYDKQVFSDSLENIRSGKRILEGESLGEHYLKQEIQPLLSQITQKVQRTHPEKKLESLVAKIFRNMPNVLEAKVNGSGFGSDFGADVIVEYDSGIGILSLQKRETLVVQVKSYTDTHWETLCISQIETAINKFNADAGLLISTAEPSENLEFAIEELSARLEKPIGLIAGENVAKFILKYEKGLLIEI